MHSIHVINTLLLHTQQHNNTHIYPLSLSLSLSLSSSLAIKNTTTMKHYTTTHNNYNYLMWSKTPIISPMNSFIISSPSPWQEHNNYQEPFGGLAWPPRSYTCTFCRREFRSAQALGGHMNVHRRDRARLKHSSPPPQPHQTDPILHHHQDHTSADSCPENILSHKENGSNDDDLVETKLSMGIDLVDPGNVVCKRHKKSSSSSTVSSCPLPFLHTKPCSSSMEDIDLELRLGDPPAVK